MYLHTETKANEDIYTLIDSKTRVSPKRGETIPRMELMGGLILTRLLDSILIAIVGTLIIDEVRCWSNSQIALWSLWADNKEFTKFVERP